MKGANTPLLPVPPDPTFVGAEARTTGGVTERDLRPAIVLPLSRFLTACPIEEGVEFFGPPSDFLGSLPLTTHIVTHPPE